MTENLKRFCDLYCDLYKQQNDIIAKEWEEKKPTDIGVLEVTFKHKGISVLIHIDENNSTIKRMEFDNEMLWEYVVNDAYENSKKNIYFSRYNSKHYDQVTLSDETSAKIEYVWKSNEEFCKLQEDLMLYGRFLSKSLLYETFKTFKQSEIQETIINEIEKFASKP